MLVKNVDPSKYTVDMATVPTIQQEKKITNTYCHDPVTIVFHDDNYGVTSALWETYYRYYFQDGRYGKVNGVGDPETTYSEFARERIFPGEKYPKIWIRCRYTKVLPYKYTNISKWREKLILATH